MTATINPKYASLFDVAVNPSEPRTYNPTGIAGYRAKTIRSGPIVEVEAYPIWDTSANLRRAKQRITPEAQRRLNEKNAVKKLVRKVNANFDASDMALTLTYAGEPPNLERAKKDMQNYIRRIKNLRKKKDLPELKYIYTIEYTGEGGRIKKRVHHHLIMSGGLTRDKAEMLWPMGYANSKRLQPDEHGLEALARYMVKEPAAPKKAKPAATSPPSSEEGRAPRRWYASKNLADPIITVADKKLSRRAARLMAEDITARPKEIFEKLYPGCTYTDCSIYYSDYVSGAYIYARLRDAQKPKTKNGGNENVYKTKCTASRYGHLPVLPHPGGGENQ